MKYKNLQKHVLMLLTNAFDPDPRVHQEAKALVNAGYQVTILCWDREFKSSPFEIIDGIKVERIFVKSTHGRGATQFLFLFLFWLKALFKTVSKDFDVVHCHDFDTLPFGFLIAKTRNKKLVYDAHESYVDMLGNVPFWMKKLIFWAENFILKRTDLVITVGEILREYLSRRGAPKTCVVGNWKDPKDFLFSVNLIAEERKRLGISEDQIVISFIANLGYERQLPQLVKAVEKNPSIFLILGGKGPAKKLAEDAASGFPNIIYLGYVHPSRVPFYTALSDLIFYGFDPSNPNARFSAPNKLFEALAAGRPVITGNFGEIGKIVNDCACGIVLEAYTTTAIRLALNKMQDRSNYKRLRESAANASYAFSWCVASKTLLYSYGSL